MSLRRLLASVTVIASFVAACKKDSSGPPVPTSVAISATAVNLTSINQTRQLGAAVLDQHGDTMIGQPITWTTNNMSVATVSGTGLVTAAGNGSAQVAAHSGALNSTPATVTVTQAAAALVKVVGDAQTDTVGQQLPTTLTAQVNDALGSPVAGVTIGFAVTQGGGTVSAPSGVSGANGRVGVTWTIGTTAGAAQQVTVSASGATNITFSATAVAGAPDNVIVQAGNNQTSPSGLPVPVAPAVKVRDQYNNNVAGVSVGFAVTSGGGSVTGASQTTNAQGVATVGSWTLGPAGPQTLDATVTPTVTGSPLTFNATATAAGAPATVLVTAGNNQTGLVGYALNVNPAVQVVDANSAPVSGVSVTFAVTGGGGSISGPATVTTNVGGIATVGGWLIGAAPGPNTMTATVTSLTPATFNATGQAAAYTVDVRFRKPVTAAQQAAFDSARVRWERSIYGDQQDIPVNLPDSIICVVTASDTFYIPPMNETVDDIVIFATLDSIDGPLNTVGLGTWCGRRLSNDLPVIGLMIFDTADVATFLSQGLFDEIVLHEMGHSLGYHPTTWNFKSLLVGAGGADPHFVGTQAIAAFDQSGGAGYVAGAKVPLENTGGSGTRNNHWRESVFDTELMTGFLNSGVPNPLSAITIASMGDLGYTVNYAAADPYVVANPLALRATAGVTIELREPPIRRFVLVFDDRGRIVRVERPSQ